MLTLKHVGVLGAARAHRSEYVGTVATRNHANAVGIDPFLGRFISVDPVVTASLPTERIWFGNGSAPIHQILRSTRGQPWNAAWFVAAPSSE